MSRPCPARQPNTVSQDPAASSLGPGPRLAGVDLQTLDPLQRVLLITDGTVTDILEIVFLEPIRLVKIRQRIVPAGSAHLRLHPEAGESILERSILLEGVRSERRYVRAESMIAVDRLSEALRDRLLNSDEPLGRLWIEQKLETFKELLEVHCDGEPRRRLDSCGPAGRAVGRTYRVFVGRRPVMLITEHFLADLGPLTAAPAR